MEVAGKVKLIDTTKEVGTSGFKKRDIVVTSDEQYPQDILVQFVQDKCDILDKYNVGENVVIGINLRGREWINPEGKAVYFNTIQGWKINHGEQDSEPLPADAKPIFEMTNNLNKEDFDDLPFN